MNRMFKSTVIRRFLEFLLWEVLLSVVITALTTAEGASTKWTMVLFTFVGVIIYTVINILLQRRCCFDLADKDMYYKANYAAYAMFFVVNMLCVFLLNNNQYTWLFVVTQTIRYLYVIIPKSVSALVFHLLMVFSIWVSPYGMDNLIRVVSEGRNLDKHSRDFDDNDDDSWFNIPEGRKRID